MDDRVVCGGCGEWYYPRQAWAHERCAALAKLAAPEVVILPPEESLSTANEANADASRGEVEAPAKAPEKRWGYADAGKRRAYMRDYMRRRRAAGKA